MFRSPHVQRVMDDVLRRVFTTTLGPTLCPVFFDSPEVGEGRKRGDGVSEIFQETL